MQFKSLHQKIGPIEHELASSRATAPNGEAYRRRLLTRKHELEAQIRNLPKDASTLRDEGRAVSDNGDSTDDSVAINTTTANARPHVATKGITKRPRQYSTATMRSSSFRCHSSFSANTTTRKAMPKDYWKRSIAPGVKSSPSVVEALFIELWLQCGPAVARATVEQAMHATDMDDCGAVLASAKVGERVSAYRQELLAPRQDGVLTLSRDEILPCSQTDVHVQRAHGFSLHLDLVTPSTFLIATTVGSCVDLQIKQEPIDQNEPFLGLKSDLIQVI